MARIFIDVEIYLIAAETAERSTWNVDTLYRELSEIGKVAKLGKSISAGYSE